MAATMFSGSFRSFSFSLVGCHRLFRISMAKEKTKQPCAARALKTTALLLTHG